MGRTDGVEDGTAVVIGRHRLEADGAQVVTGRHRLEADGAQVTGRHRLEADGAQAVTGRRLEARADGSVHWPGTSITSPGWGSTSTSAVSAGRRLGLNCRNAPRVTAPVAGIALLAQAGAPLHDPMFSLSF
jgi:hypothetical protein